MATVPAGVETLWFTDTRMRVLVAEDTCSLVETEATAGNMPPLHVHHAEDEMFYVLEGRLTLLTALGSVELPAGCAAFAPRGIPHVYRVDSERARWLASTTSGGFASFVRETSVPAEGGGYAPPGRTPAPAMLAEAAGRYGIEILGPPGATP